MDFVAKIRKLAKAGALRTSDHAYGRLAEKGISYRQLVASLDNAEILERYPVSPWSVFSGAACLRE